MRAEAWTLRFVGDLMSYSRDFLFGISITGKAKVDGYLKQ